MSKTLEDRARRLIDGLQTMLSDGSKHRYDGVVYMPSGAEWEEWRERLLREFRQVAEESQAKPIPEVFDYEAAGD